MATLVLINGAPGSGKSTIARLLVDERPLALLLDIDTLRAQLGQWSADPRLAGITARRLALALIRTHLAHELDVVVPQFLARSTFIEEMDRTALGAGGAFIEIALVSSPEEAAARFAARSESADPNHRDAVQLQQAAGAQPIEVLYRNMLDMLRQERPLTQYVESVPGDIAGTLARVRSRIEATVPANDV